MTCESNYQTCHLVINKPLISYPVTWSRPAIGVKHTCTSYQTYTLVNMPVRFAMVSFRQMFPTSCPCLGLCLCGGPGPCPGPCPCPCPCGGLDLDLGLCPVSVMWTYSSGWSSCCGWSHGRWRSWTKRNAGGASSSSDCHYARPRCLTNVCPWSCTHCLGHTRSKRKGQLEKQNINSL